MQVALSPVSLARPGTRLAARCVFMIGLRASGQAAFTSAFFLQRLWLFFFLLLTGAQVSL
jgi:hypothetical protein